MCTESPLARRAKVALLALVALAASCSPHRSNAQVPISPKTTRLLVAQALSTAANRRHLLIDPRLTGNVTASVTIFISNFCYPSNSPAAIERCDKTVHKKATLTYAVGKFLDEITDSRPAQVKTVGAFLANSIGMKMSMTGWPPDENNIFGVIALPPELANACINFSAMSAHGTSPFPVHAIVTIAGPLTLYIRRGGCRSARHTLSMDIRARSSVALKSTKYINTHQFSRIDPPLDEFCYRYRGPRSTGPTKPFNWGRDRFAETQKTTKEHEAQFSRQPGLDITIINRTSLSCNVACKNGIAATFIQAVAVWRTGCARCSANALVAIRVGPSVWLDQRIAIRLNSLKGTSRSSVISPLFAPSNRHVVNTQISHKSNRGSSLNLYNSDNISRYFISAPSSNAPLTSIVGYDNITSDKQLIMKICRLPKDAATWVTGVKRLLCDEPEHIPVDWLSPKLVVLQESTKCGAVYMACGIPNGIVEISTQNVRYKISTPDGPVILGTNDHDVKVELKFVILHEVGHWFGVPHAQRAGPHAFLDIMSNTYGVWHPCVSAQSLIMLNNAADTRWPWRQRRMAGLKPP